jgi:hypothetical protein
MELALENLGKPANGEVIKFPVVFPVTREERR